MKPQTNTIFLSYSQDVVNRLPNAIYQALNNIGYKVFMDTAYFTRFEEPSERIKNEIKSCTYFLLLVTPASLRYGFRGSEKRLPAEFRIAKESNKLIVILLAYDKTQGDGWGWYMSKHLPQNPNFCSILIDRFSQSIQQLTYNFQEKLLVPDNDLESLTSYTDKELKAEALLDKALVEQYESEVDNRTSRCAEIINQAIEIDPDFADAYYRRAEINRPLVKYDDKKQRLVADYSKAIELDPTKVRYYIGIGNLYRRLQQDDKAVASYSKAIELAPYTYEGYSERAGVHTHTQQFSLALQDYSIAIKHHPNNKNLWVRRGRLYQSLGKTELAIADYSKSLDIRKDWRIYAIRGLLYADIDMIREADEDWQMAIDLTEDLESVYLFCARVHSSRNEYVQAVQILDEFIDIHADNQRAIKLKNTILTKMNS